MQHPKATTSGGGSLLDEADNDPTRFLTYFVAALQGVDPSIDQTAQGLLVSPQPAPVDQVMTPLVRDLAQLAQPLVLVLDDYHHPYPLMLSYNQLLTTKFILI